MPPTAPLQAPGSWAAAPAPCQSPANHPAAEGGGKRGGWVRDALQQKDAAWHWHVGQLQCNGLGMAAQHSLASRLQRLATERCGECRAARRPLPCPWLPRRTSSCWYRRFTAARSLRDSSDAHFSSLGGCSTEGLKRGEIRKHGADGGRQRWRRRGSGSSAPLQPAAHLSLCSQNCASAFSSTLSSSTLQAGAGRAGEGSGRDAALLHALCTHALRPGRCCARRTSSGRGQHPGPGAGPGAGREEAAWLQQCRGSLAQLQRCPSSGWAAAAGAAWRRSSSSFWTVPRAAALAGAPLRFNHIHLTIVAPALARSAHRSREPRHGRARSAAKSAATWARITTR